MICSICGSANIVIYKKVQSPYIDALYTLYNCKECASFFFNADEHEFDLNEWYNKSDHEVDFKFKKSRGWQKQAKIISGFISNKENPSVIDIGCRTGDFLLHFDKCFSIYGAELNEANAKIAAGRGIKIYSGNIEKIDFRDKFDVVTCFAILEHIANPNNFLKKLISLVKDQGILIIMIPTIESELRVKLDEKNIHWHMYSPPEHLSFYSRKFLDNYFSKAGFILKKRYFASGGLGGIYNRYFGNSYSLLKNPNFKKLNTYYLNKDKNYREGFLGKIALLVYKVFLRLSEGIIFFNKRNYFDHMYSYYKKTS